MNSDFVDLLKLLGKWKVDYAIIGGYAVMEYSEPRATKDLDILIACSKTNAKKVFAALREFGGVLSGIDQDFFSKKGRFYKIGRPPNRIDIITSAEGAPFSEIKSQRVKKHIHGVQVFFIGRKQLMKLKKAAGRPQDLLDLANLKKFEQLTLAKKKASKKKL